MTTLTVKIDNKKTEKAVKAILEALGLSYNVGEMKKEITKPQTLKQYNADLENGNSEIERGEFITAIQLKDELNKW